VLRERSSAAAWGRLGKVLLAHGFNAAANRCFQQAESLDPAEPAWPYLQGLNLAVNDPEASIRCLERAVPRFPAGSADGPRLLLAEVLLEQGRLDQARPLLEDVHNAEPGNLRARLGLGRLALLRQDWRAGLEHLEACRDDVHARKRACALRAEAWDQLGEAERARAVRRLWAELPEDEPWPDPLHEDVLKLKRGLRARFEAVDHLFQAGRAEDAIPLLRQTLDRYPQSDEAWMRLGDLCSQTGQPDRAEACYREALRIAPDMADAWFRLGGVQALTHSPEAEASFRQALRLKPDHARAHFGLGQCLRERGDRDGAAAEFRAALRCRPDFERARTGLQELEAPEEKPG
jgi:tetratricopeptide (TPR) repeat protein